MDKGQWPRCLLWHGWHPKLSGVNGASPWAASAADCAGYFVESALGSYSSSFFAASGPPVRFDAVAAASLLPDSRNVWTDGSLLLDRVTGVSSSGAVFFFFCSSACFLLGIIGVGVMLIRFARLVIFILVRVFVLFLGLSSPFRELSCGVSFLLCNPLVLFILVLTILSVVRHVGRLLDGRHGPTPFELVKDGGLLLLIERMLQLRVWVLLGLLRLRVMLMRVWFLTVGFRGLINWVMMLLMRLLTSVVGELAILSLTLGVISLGSVGAGTLFFLTFIDFHCYF